jgi:hypothetical protein
MKYNGTGWAPVGSMGFSAGEAPNVSLALDAQGTPYVAYRDFANGYKATVMKYDGSNWVPVGSPGFSAGDGNYIRLALDAQGMPYVAYEDWANGHKATVMRYNGTGWAAVGSPGFSAGYAQSTSLALDAQGSPYVAYTDCGNGGKATVMAYLASSTPPVTTITPSPATPDGPNGWYKSPVALRVSATSALTSTQETRCVLDPSSPPTSFDDLPPTPACPYLGAGAVVSAGGSHTLYATAGTAGTGRTCN